MSPADSTTQASLVQWLLPQPRVCGKCSWLGYVREEGGTVTTCLRTGQLRPEGSAACGEFWERW